MASSLTWLGHSTVLLELNGSRILTDPLLRSRVAHLRRRAPAPLLDGPVDAVLISHAHWDHLDIGSLRLVDRDATIVVPVGVGRLIEKLGFAQVVQLPAGETTEVAGVQILATRADHRTSRWPRGAVTPAIGFVVGGPHSIYFAGDTDLFEELSDLAPVDVALLPVSGWGPTLPEGHLNPESAAIAAGLLQASLAVPIHWGTYSPIASASPRTAPEEFRRRASQLAPGVEVRVLEVGETISL